MRYLAPASLGAILLASAPLLFFAASLSRAAATAPSATNGDEENPRYSLAEQVAAEVATILCEDPGYQRCTAEAQGRCVLEMGLIANRCAATAEGESDTSELTAVLTGCLINEHARLLSFESEGLLSCFAGSSNKP